MNLNEKQLEKYLNDVNYGVLDLEKTSDKWENYKTEKWVKIVEQIGQEYKDLISDSEDMTDIIFSRMFDGHNHYRSNMIIGRIKDNCIKSNLKSLKHEVNYHMRNFNLEFITSRIDGLNENEKNGFTIRLYLWLYDDINLLMKNILFNIVYDYCK